MRVGHGPSWVLRCDFPEYLQLSGTIAQQEGFQPGADTRTATLVETQWLMWWESLMLPPAGFAMLPNQTDPWRRVNYDPPDFTRLAHWPAIQALCRRHYPAFHQHWGTIGGDKDPMTVLLHEQLTRVRVDRIVNACAAAAGKRESAPFDLTVDFVVWPADYERVSSDTYVVLGKQYLEPEQVESLRELLRSSIAKLV